MARANTLLALLLAAICSGSGALAQRPLRVGVVVARGEAPRMCSKECQAGPQHPPKLATVESSPPYNFLQPPWQSQLNNSECMRPKIQAGQAALV